MARKRVKDRSKLSVLIKFDDEMQSEAIRAVDVIYKAFPRVKKAESFPPQEGQKYTIILLQME